MGGIIVIDFIDMTESANRQNCSNIWIRQCSNRAKHNILPLSKFWSYANNPSARVRPAMDVETTESCPTCFGTGTVKPSILFTESLEGKIDCLVNKHNVKKFVLHVHPYVAAFINKGIFPLLEVEMKYTYEFLKSFQIKACFYGIQIIDPIKRIGYARRKEIK